MSSLINLTIIGCIKSGKTTNIINLCKDFNNDEFLIYNPDKRKIKETIELGNNIIKNKFNTNNVISYNLFDFCYKKQIKVIFLDDSHLIEYISIYYKLLDLNLPLIITFDINTKIDFLLNHSKEKIYLNNNFFTNQNIINVVNNLCGLSIKSKINSTYNPIYIFEVDEMSKIKYYLLNIIKKIDKNDYIIIVENEKVKKYIKDSIVDKINVVEFNKINKLFKIVILIDLNTVIKRDFNLDIEEYKKYWYESIFKSKNGLYIITFCNPLKKIDNKIIIDTYYNRVKNVIKKYYNINDFIDNVKFRNECFKFVKDKLFLKFTKNFKDKNFIINPFLFKYYYYKNKYKNLKEILNKEIDNYIFVDKIHLNAVNKLIKRGLIFNNRFIKNNLISEDLTIDEIIFIKKCIKVNKNLLSLRLIYKDFNIIDLKLLIEKDLNSFINKIYNLENNKNIKLNYDKKLDNFSKRFLKYDIDFNKIIIHPNLEIYLFPDMMINNKICYFNYNNRDKVKYFLSLNNYSTTRNSNKSVCVINYKKLTKFKINKNIWDFNCMLSSFLNTKMKENIFILDLETNIIGFNNPCNMEIIDRYIYEYNLNCVVSDGLIKNNYELSEFIINLTGITNELMIELNADKDLSKFKEEMNKIEKYTYMPKFVAHNGLSFDFRILRYYNLLNYNLVKLIDTRYFLPKYLKLRNVFLVDSKLLTIYKTVFNLEEFNQEHRAKGDTLMIVDMFNKLNIKNRHNY